MWLGLWASTATAWVMFRELREIPQAMQYSQEKEKNFKDKIFYEEQHPVLVRLGDKRYWQKVYAGVHGHSPWGKQSNRQHQD